MSKAYVHRDQKSSNPLSILSYPILSYPIIFYAGGYNTKNVCICGNKTYKQAIEL